MRIIGTDQIEAFCRKRPDARRHFDRWLQAVEGAAWKKWADVRQTYAKASKAGFAWYSTCRAAPFGSSQESTTIFKLFPFCTC